MSLRLKQFYYFALMATVLTLSIGVGAQSRAYRVSDRQVQTLLDRIETNTQTFRQNIQPMVANRNQPPSYRDEGIVSYVSNFENSLQTLKNNFKDRRSTADDVREVLNHADVINSFLRNNRISTQTQDRWRAITNDLGTLAIDYRLTWKFDDTNYSNNANYPNTQNYPNNRYQGFDSRITGTYRLNSAQSDNVSDIVARAATDGNYDNDQNQRVRRQLERRLVSPEMLMIQKQGQQVTLGSSTSPQASFAADNVAHSEISPNGRTVHVRAVSTRNELTINYLGDRMSDYYVSFAPMDNGQLKVTRRVNIENGDQTVTATSVYDKTDRTARWDSVNSPTITGSGSVNDYVIPNSTRLTATLDTALSTKTVNSTDRFSMTVTSPSQYYGAIIEGRVIAEKSGVVSGRANLSLSFDTIRMRNGSTYRFAGIVEQVRKPSGDIVSVNNEGAVRDSNQTKKTVTRAGIGAVVGGIIGAIAGGGQGAVIGAGVGAGAGVGTVILQGRDNLELPRGSEFTLTAGAPNNTQAYR